MRHVFGLFAIALSATVCGSADASTLTLVVPNHMVLVHPTAGQQQVTRRTRSKNGTTVDGVKITAPALLRSGSVITFGSIQLVYRLATPDAETESLIP